MSVLSYPKSSQHATAGPYSPVIGVNPGAGIYVISGQAPVDDTGRVVGKTLAEQSRVTLNNCAAQLAAAQCNFDDVFKVTVYLSELANWKDFNKIYQEYFDAPYPARTAIGCALLPEFLVEIEMWAAK